MSNECREHLRVYPNFYLGLIGFCMSAPISALVCLAQFGIYIAAVNDYAEIINLLIVMHYLGFAIMATAAIRWIHRFLHPDLYRAGASSESSAN